MVGLTLLAKLNQILCVAKHVDRRVPFGSMNVFFGDYLQYRPVYDTHCTLILHDPSKRDSTVCCPFPDSSNQLCHQTYSADANGRLAVFAAA